jgi:hypothetical protein
MSGRLLSLNKNKYKEAGLLAFLLLKLSRRKEAWPIFLLLLDILFLITGSCFETRFVVRDKDMHS